MEILRSNFDQTLPILTEAIKEADFFCIDGEFSGIGDHNFGFNPYDSPQLLYAKCKRSVDKYMLMQLGLCAFKYDSNANGFTYKAFNIYLFPRVGENLRSVRSCIVDCMDNTIQSDCMTFLGDRGFDFNKWINSGVSFIRDNERILIEESLTTKFDRKVSAMNRKTEQLKVARNCPNIPDSVKRRVNEAWTQVKQLIQNGESGQTIEFTDMNALERRSLTQLSEFYHYSKLMWETKKVDGVDCCALYITKCSDLDEKIRFYRDKHDAQMAEVRKAEGFTEVIKLLSESGKPIVGHNVRTDLMHILRTFMTDLPPLFDDFQTLAHSIFPSVYDTKVVCTNPSFNNILSTTALPELINVVNSDRRFSDINILPKENQFGYTDINNPGMHDAGFDAYSTGVVFIKLCDFVSRTKDIDRTTADLPWNTLTPVHNLMSCGGRHQLLRGLSLVNHIPLQHQHIFHMTFPVEWKYDDIAGLFAPFGKIRVYFVDDIQALVTLHMKQNHAKVVPHLCGIEGKPWKVQTLGDYILIEEKKYSTA